MFSIRARFTDEIYGTQLQCLERDFGCTLGIRRHHHDRHRAQAHQPFEKLQTIHARHVHIQRQHVRIELFDRFAGTGRIRRLTNHFHIGKTVDHGRQHASHQRRIIYDQHTNFGKSHEI